MITTSSGPMFSADPVVCSTEAWTCVAVDRAVEDHAAPSSRVRREASATRSGASSSGRTAFSRAKKAAHSAEQDRPDILKPRHVWFDGPCLELDPKTSRLRIDVQTWAIEPVMARASDIRPVLPGSHRRLFRAVMPVRPLEEAPASAVIARADPPSRR